MLFTDFLKFLIDMILLVLVLVIGADDQLLGQLEVKWCVSRVLMLFRVSLHHLLVFTLLNSIHTSLLGMKKHDFLWIEGHTLERVRKSDKLLHLLITLSVRFKLLTITWIELKHGRVEGGHRVVHPRHRN